VDELGAVLRWIREAAGLSLAGMAARTNYSRPYLGLVETGRRAALPAVVQAYENVRLGLEDVDRRSLLGSLLAGAVAPSVLFSGIRAGYEQLLNSDPPDTDEWLGMVSLYGRDYMFVGAAEMQSRLARDLIVLREHLESPQLWGVAAKLLTVHGKTIPSGELDGAVGWYKLAARAADRSGEWDTRVWVRGRSALALAYEGASLPIAVGLAQQALAISDRPSLGAVNAYMALAHVAGWNGHAEVAIKAMRASQRAFDVAGSHEQISDFAVPEWRMSTFCSMLLSRLGDRRAEAEQENADRTRPAELPRFATHIELHRALAMVKSGDVVGGHEYAGAAMGKLPQAKQSLTLQMLMREILSSRERPRDPTRPRPRP
jgi:transcriptional regulator with XRE-family HTH domain